MDNIRNFVIIAHIDHGKSTLADRFLEYTESVDKRKMRAQYLDQMELEKEKGITIKMQPVRMRMRPRIQNPETKDADLSEIPNFDFYVFNLIDTPGHVDFAYEVSRALAAVEGAILLVDATQGVQAQTIANLHFAQKEGLAIIPAINKIDLPSAEIERTKEELGNLLDILPEEVFEVSAKTGKGVERLLWAVAEKIPPPRRTGRSENAGTPNAPLRALIFDSKYDPYQGVIAHVRVFEGRLRVRDRVRFMATGAEAEIAETGIFAPERIPVAELSAGEIGYVATGIKEPGLVRVGDTITANNKPEMPNAKNSDGKPFGPVEPLPGYHEPIPVVFSSFFPENQDEYEGLRDALEKLKLEDAALVFEPEESSVLGRGFRAGFLGMLHMEIISERIRREYEIDLVISNPSVAFKVFTKNGGKMTVYSAGRMPAAGEIERIEEPMALGEIVTPPHFLGPVTLLINEHQGAMQDTATLAGERMVVKFLAPLREIVVDFYDALKSISQGFASFSYEVAGYERSDLVTVDILVAGEKIPSLAEVLPREKVYLIARARIAKLKELMPRALFAIALQAESGGRIIARETIPALKKDVTGYLYGGDRTRKMKLWKKQQRGKKRLKEQGRVEIPPDVFLKLLKRS